MPRGIDLDLSSGLKTCARCQTEKPLAEFGKSSRTKLGVAVYCKRCMSERHDKWRRANLKKAAEDQKRRRHADPERFREYERKAAYGLQPGEYARILAEQDGKCAICRRASNNGRGHFHVDHCHDGGQVRGLLCHGCNVSLGHFQHNTAVLEAAISYLNRTSQRMR